jgi:hypothetical protein
MAGGQLRPGSTGLLCGSGRALRLRAQYDRPLDYRRVDDRDQTASPILVIGIGIRLGNLGERLVFRHRAFLHRRNCGSHHRRLRVLRPFARRTFALGFRGRWTCLGRPCRRLRSLPLGPLGLRRSRSVLAFCYAISKCSLCNMWNGRRK